MMKNLYRNLLLTAALLFTGQVLLSQVVSYADSWGSQGITVQKNNTSGVNLNYSINEFSLVDQHVDGAEMKTVLLPDVYLPNDEGAPNLPGMSRYIMIPEGAEVKVNLKSSRVESMKNIDIAPAPRIPLDTEDGPMLFSKDQSIYSANAFYPAETVLVSEPMQIRGVDVVMLGITPFQYNPVTKELLVYRDLEIEVVFEGGTKTVGEDRLRSRWWDQIIYNTVLNADILPEMDYNKQSMAPSDSPDFEYIIITPDDPTFLAWADSIRNFRMLQGIYTGIVTTSEIGGNTVSAIESYVDNAYNSWTVAPSAVLLLGDYGTSGSTVTSQFFTHPAGYPDFVSDNQFADVDGDDLPDIAFARITANNASQLEVMITKFLDYERNPPTNADFYDHPITALGWQTERWFQICSEVVGGYLKNVQGKNPVRINAVYSGSPTSDPWSTATNTSTVMNYFGPNGLGYIPATPQELGGFSGGSATDVANAINNGSYMLQHRDHGYYGGWGEPAFSTTSINALTNVNNELPFIFSINCQTGAFHRSTESFAEKFHRYTYNGQNSGALGLLAATEVSYSFVNDTYVWGVFDNMHPDFMPDKSTQFPVSYAMPAFGNAAGKHFLAQSSWPYNTSSKQITYRLFHHHGDAFLTMYTEVPQNLAVNHSGILQAASTTFTVDADAESLIALTINGDIVATADGTGSPLDISIPQQNPGDVMVVTVTKQNYFRYSANVDVVSSGLFAQFYADQTSICSGGSVNFTDDSYGDVTSWNWSFPGGTPSSYNGQYPPVVSYATPGSYDVALTVSDGSSNDTQTKTGYITVNSLVADFTGTPTTLAIGSAVYFTDNSTCNPTSWNWSFPGGTPSTSTAQNPVVTYNTAGVYQVSLTASNGSGSDTETRAGYITVSEVPLNYCSSQGNTYSYEWIGQVDFDDFSNSSGAAGYTDFTNLEVDLTAGASVDVTLTPAFASATYVEYWRIWIDYNRDGDFEDANEQVFAPGSSTTVVSGSFNVLASAIGKTRMRVTMKYNGVPTSCETFSYGEVEDYTVNFSSASPPVADFIAGATTILEGKTVDFTDLTTNTPTSWTWTFEGGDPASSTAQNPGVTYNTSGVYDVSLTAGNVAGSDTETKTSYITVVPMPGCAGVVAPTDGQTGVGLEADLQWNAATNASGYKLFLGTDNPPTNLVDGVDLGDVLTFDPGTLDYETTYYWNLVSYNNYGERQDCDVWSFTTEIEPVLPPVCATLVSPANGATGTLITADLDWGEVAEADGYKIFFGTDNPPTNIENGTDLGAATLYNPSGDLAYSTTYYWKVVAYNAGGDATGCSTWSFTSEDEPIPPPACVTLVSPADMAVNVSVTEVLNWNAAPDATGYKLSLGSDNPPTNLINNTDLGNVTTFDPVGILGYGTTYYWQVMAYNDGGDATGCAVWSFSTEVLPPVANFTSNSTTVFEGESVTFTDLSSNNPTSWEWSFTGGDPASSTEQNPTIVYPTAGVYSVSLIAANDGGSDQIIKTDYITVNVKPPVTDFTASATYVMVGESVDFTDLSTENPTSWEWTFDGGTPATSNLQNPTITYSSPGLYDVILTATNAGGSDTETKTGYIEVWDGSVNYCTAGGSNWSTEWISRVDFGSFSNSSGAAGYSDFTSQIINVEGGLTYNVVLYPTFSGKSRREFWRVWIDYNNDGDFTDYDEEVVAADAKKNQVNATVTIPSGMSGQTRMRVAMKYQFAPTSCENFSYGEVEDYTINVGAPVPQPPVAAFSADQTSIAPGGSIQFTDESSNNPTSWSWSFSGGTPASSTDQNPVVVYDGVGTFDVTLTATNDEGSDVLTKSGYIVVADNPVNYCESYGQSNAVEWISGVTIGSFYNSSGAAGYSDFTGSVVPLSPGASSSATLVPGYSGKDEREFWRIWIDFNGDFDFEDADETVLVANNKKGTFSGNITIPSYATGQTRMRVSMKGGGSPTSCEIFPGGEVEDYTVDFGAKGALGITDPGSLHSSVYPNPAGSTVNIFASSTQTTVKMYDMHGKLIKAFDMEGLEIEVDISDLNQGLYMIEFISSEGIRFEKLIKQ